MSLKRIEVAESNLRDSLPLPLLPCGSWMFLKENSDKKEVDNHQSLFMLINFTCKFCYWHRQTWKFLKSFSLLERSSHLRFFWARATLKNIRRVPGAHPQRSATFLQLHVGRQQIYKNCTSAQVFAKISRKSSDQHLGLSMRDCPSLSGYEPDSNCLV